MLTTITYDWQKHLGNSIIITKRTVIASVERKASREPKLINGSSRERIRFGLVTITPAVMGESKEVFRRDVGNLFMLSISAIFHNTNNANDGDRSLIKQSNFEFRIEVISRNSCAFRNQLLFRSQLLVVRFIFINLSLRFQKFKFNEENNFLNF